MYTLSILEREQKQSESAMENIMNAVERGFYTAAANKRMKELEKRQEELERLIIIWTRWESLPRVLKKDGADVFCPQAFLNPEPIPLVWNIFRLTKVSLIV